MQIGVSWTPAKGNLAQASTSAELRVGSRLWEGTFVRRMSARGGRRRMRRALSHLDDLTLRDIGISRADLGYDAGDMRGIADVLALLTDLQPR